MNTKITMLVALGLITIFACNPTENGQAEINSSLFVKSNLVAWCIVPFDSVERSPQERAEMLQELSISHLAYDWREQHLPTFETELKVLKENNINLQAVWFWIEQDSVGYLGEANERLWDKIVTNNIQTECWFSFAPQFFEGLPDEAKLRQSIQFIGSFRDRAKQQGCTLGMYNHGDWFGNPMNQLDIIDSLGDDHLGMVYNFHHAHHEIDEFPVLLEKIEKHLLCINLNGMIKEGEKILALGKGTEELAMLQAIQDSNYRGPIGIIGHQAERDVEKVLRENLRGLSQLKAELE
ncbi:MAG: AP endonuclease [Bacteroidota bacterium]